MFRVLLHRWRAHAFTRNWSLLVVSGLLCQVLGMCATIRIARALAPAGYGQYNLVQTTAGLGAVFAALGLRNVITRYCARNPGETAAVLTIAAGLRAIGVLGAALFVIGYERILGGSLSLSFMLAALLLLAGLNLWDTVESVAFGNDMMQYSATINLGGSCLWIVAAWAVPVAWLTPITVSIGFAVLQFGEAVTYIAIAVRRGLVRTSTFRVVEARRIGLTLVRDGAPFWWFALLSAATGQLPILMLNAGSGRTQVGLYNAGYRLVSPLQLLIMTALAALYPGLSRLGHVDGARLATVIGRALVAIAGLGTVGALALSLLRKEVILALFGEKFSGAADAMAFQCWYTVLVSVISLIVTALAATDRQRLLAGLATCNTVIGLPIIWLGASRGASGMALAMLASVLINLSYHWMFFVRALPVPLPRTAVFRAVIFLVTGMGLSWLVPPSDPFIIRVGLLGLVFTALAIGILLNLTQRTTSLPQPIR